jgi:hypothetical protein
MEESSFVKIFEDASKEVFKDTLIVKRKANLLYELALNNKLDLYYPDTKFPKRGSSAFQTDICVFEKIGDTEYPRVVIEFKTNISTHDIITYSYKAGEHKRIYPGLRYGLLASEIESIPDRFFIHNKNLDFFIAAKNYKENNLHKMVKELIIKEVETSKTIEKIYSANEKFNYYRTETIFKTFDETKNI